MSKIKIGTAGWEGGKVLYPPGLRSMPSEAKLPFYSAEFPIVEVDTSYHAIPREETTRVWAKSTPPDFTFNVKAFRLFTHHFTQPASLPGQVRSELPSDLAHQDSLHYWEVPGALRRSLWKTFEDALSPLHATGKLGVVVLQFPSHFTPTKTNLEHLQDCKEILGKYRVGVELRNPEWFQRTNIDRLMGFLERNDLLYIGVDGPQDLKTSVPPVVASFGDICVIRFHGHNVHGWAMTGPNAKAERGNYRYSPDDFDPWIRRVRAIESRVDEVHLVINTNSGGDGARLLADLLGEGIKQQSSLFYSARAS